MRQRLGWILLCAVALIGTARFALAQQSNGAVVGSPPTIITGPDLGFVVEGHHGSMLKGHFVVRQKGGNWEPIEITPPGGSHIQPLTMR